MTQTEMQKTETQVLSYKLEDFMKYRDVNTEAPFEITPYFCGGQTFERPNLKQYMDHLELVNSSLNDTESEKVKTLIKTIKFCINIMNKKNYEKCVSQMLKLDYSGEEAMQILVQELVMCGMKCPIAIKGMQKEANVKPISELCVDVVKQFSLTSPTIIDELLNVCRKFFMNFVDLTKSMDENNESTVDNYKGFTSLMGLLYSQGLIPTKMIIECIELVKRTIFNTQVEPSEMILTQTLPHHDKMFGHKKQSKSNLCNSIAYYDTVIPSVENSEQQTDTRLLCYRKQIECTNYYKGYEHLMNSVVCTLGIKIKEFKKNDELLKKSNEYIETFNKLHEEFIELNKRFKIKNKNQYANPLKPHILILHNDLDEKLKILRKSSNI